MSKFNRGPLRTHAQPLTRITGEVHNHEGGPGFTRDDKSALFQLAVTNMVKEDTFYESGESRDARYAGLVRSVAVEDFPWLSKMLPWLRSEGHMRSASLVGAAQAAHARIAEGQHEGCADLIDAVLQRADEPGELVAYWRTEFGKTLPKPVLKGLKRAVPRLYTERNTLKWDSAKSGYRFADVIELVHPEPRDAAQAALFRYLLDQRHHGDGRIDSAKMPMHSHRQHWYGLDDRYKIASLGSPGNLKKAGLTWENVLSELGSRVDKAELWSVLIPNLGYMAALRNLRNIDEAGVSRNVKQGLAEALQEPGNVARSRQLPFRFLSAYLNAPSDFWKEPLSVAAGHALGNVPDLGGRTLVLVDTSGSMDTSVSVKSRVSRMAAGALFGTALAMKGQGDLVGFATDSFPFPLKKGAGLLSEVERLLRKANSVGRGTNMTDAVRRHYRGHDRVVIVTDMQCFQDARGGSLSDGRDPIPVPSGVPVYGFNLAGYAATAIDSRISGRHELGGLTDHTFNQIRQLEAAESGTWPWGVR